MGNQSAPIEVFYCYTRKDEAFRNTLAKHLSTLHEQMLISSWHDREIVPGTDWEKAIDMHLETASLILLLISADFLGSDYCTSHEMKRAMERHEENRARVIPILLRPVDWHGAPFAHLQILPTDAKPVASWANQDEAFADIAQGIRRAIKDLLSKRSTRYSVSIASVGQRQVPDRNIQHPGNPVSRHETIWPRITANPHHDPSRRRVILLLGLAFLVAVALVGDGVGVSSFTNSLHSSIRTPPQSHYPPFKRLVVDDPLSDNSKGYDWAVFTTKDLYATCQFTQGAYHASLENDKYLDDCYAQESDARPLSNFAFEVQMRIIQGGCGGLIFRHNIINGKRAFYHFTVCQDGTYALMESFFHILRDYTRSAAIHTGLNQSNTIAVVASNNTLDLYVNWEKVDSVNDNTHSGGGIGVAATYAAGLTDVAYSNAEVWTTK